MNESTARSVAPRPARSERPPTWMLVLLGALVAATLAMAAVTLYSTRELGNQNAHDKATAAELRRQRRYSISSPRAS
jgi:hypothetical protein